MQYYDDDDKHYDNYEEDLHQPRRDLEEVDYIEVKEKNIFGEEVIIRKPKRRSNRTKSWKNGRRGTTESISRQNSPPIQPSHNHQQRSHGLHTSAPLPDEYEEEKVEEEAPDENNFSPPASPRTDMRSVSKTNNNHYIRGSPALQHLTINEEDGSKSTTAEAVPSLSATETTEQLNMSKMSLDSDESMDALAKLCAQHIKKNPQTPNIMDQLGGNTVLPNSELQLAQHPDDMTVLSDMTKETYFPGSVAGTVQTRQRSRNLNNSLGAISENSGASVTSGGPSSSIQRSMTSHEINEPVVPSNTTTSSATQNNMDTYDYIESTSPHLMTLQVIVGECTEAGNDEEAIDVVTQSLIHDNATSMNKDLNVMLTRYVWSILDETSGGFIYYEYVRPACVELEFFENANSRYGKQANNGETSHLMCANPKSLAATPICCDVSDQRTNRLGAHCIYESERVSFATAEERCQIEPGKELCEWGQSRLENECSFWKNQYF